MTNKTTIYSTWSGYDKYWTEYGTFCKKIQAGSNRVRGEPQNAPHPYTCLFADHVLPLCDTVNTLNGLSEPRSCKAFTPNFVAPDRNLVYIKALNKLYGNVKGSDFNAAISGAELPSSLRLIGDSARRIARSIKAARKGNWASAYSSLALRSKKSEAKNAASHWLEIQYGWVPLMKDVKDAVDFIDRRLRDPVIPKFTARAQEEREVTSGNKWATAYSRRRCQLIYYPSASLDLLDALGLTDPASVVWEKTPYSFVIDWFLPIGPWMSAITAARVLKGKVIRTDVLSNYAFGCIGSDYYQVQGGGSAKWKYIDMERSVSGQPLPPAFPTFNPLEKALSVRHAVNGIALLANLKSINI